MHGKWSGGGVLRAAPVGNGCVGSSRTSCGPNGGARVTALGVIFSRGCDNPSTRLER